MTEEQAQKHGGVIRWWLDNVDKGVCLRHTDNPRWNVTFTPVWDLDIIYVQNDEYAEFRKALVDGKTIQVNNFGEWQDLKVKIIEEIQCRNIGDCRIKPDESEFEVGDWIVDCTGLIFRVTETITIFNTKNYKKWRPQAGELYVFWDNNDGERFDYWVINTLHSVCKDKYYEDANGNKWDNIAPLEFVETLKDK